MSQLVQYINESEDWQLDVETIIERNGWQNDCGDTYGVCHNDESKVIINEQGQAELM